VASVTKVGQRLLCSNCGQHFGILGEDFIEVIHRNLGLQIQGTARLRLKCPTCHFVSYFQLTSD
jgi:transposase